MAELAGDYLLIPDKEGESFPVWKDRIETIDVRLGESPNQLSNY